MSKVRHPLDELLNFAEISESDQGALVSVGGGTNDIEDEQYGAVVPVQQEQPPDEEDKEINTKIDEIYSTAMEAYQQQTAYVEILEPRYAARNAEVAAQYLNTALNAVSLKAKVKNEKRKATTGFIPYANQGGVNNNIVVADRNQLLKMMVDGNMKTYDNE